jgi:hypothetical protein
MFYVIEGAIQVIVHEAKFYLAAGGMFMVPRGMCLARGVNIQQSDLHLGNTYYIRNMQDYEARMFFVQGRLMNEDDLEFYRNKMGLDESPGRSRYVHSDEIGMSGGPRRRRSPSRGMNSSSPTKRIAGTFTT